jgi:hypothetical protein
MNDLKSHLPQAVQRNRLRSYARTLNTEINEIAAELAGRYATIAQPHEIRTVALRYCGEIVQLLSRIPERANTTEGFLITLGQLRTAARLIRAAFFKEERGRLYDGIRWIGQADSSLLMALVHAKRARRGGRPGVKAPAVRAALRADPNAATAELSDRINIDRRQVRRVKNAMRQPDL